ncbi:MAG TPA: glutamine synthetase family protein [Mycobacteriales bacterium]|nr:glutamine synthetase family protein [Mycobacteriales bacterium]
MSGRGRLDLEALRREVEDGRIDTVLLVITDMQGRLQGKRMAAEHLLNDVLPADRPPGTVEGCDYLLAVDVDMNTVDGYALSGWDRGYGDFEWRPDLDTIRWIPWHEGTALIHCDVVAGDGTAVPPSPRQVLRKQLDRLAERGWSAYVGTELEFMVFQDTYEDAWKADYRGLTPANQYNVDYSMLGTARIEPLLRRIRLGMAGAGMTVESAKGECNLGQHEIAFRYGEALSTCDDHVLYKTGAKEIAAQDGRSLTFMAKYDEREGNSCHVHLSLRSSDGGPVFSDGGHGHSKTFDSFLAGLLAGMRELTLFCAPNVNSYKRYVPGSFAPTALAWGRDNRTCAFRVVGHAPPALRVENRVPGGDVNPYLAVAAMLAAGLDGVERELPLEPAFLGNAYLDADRARVPATLRESAALWTDSALARRAFGDDVVEHYANNARVELAAYDSAVTDWERRRGFERL